MKDKDLMRLALAARRMSYAPYSDYQVGAALLGEDESVTLGCNVENASYGATCCAERTAVFKAVSEGKKRFTAIAITGGSGERLNMAYPCGVCRQVLREFSEPSEMRVLVGTSVDDFEAYTLEELLPKSFGPDFKG
ncbi:MAG: cytidine deaminase [Lachnospiraceae bacterium]|nr:cytidine deaminase [Lachnospiraceae bacterium]